MASTYSNLKIELIGTGDQSGTWGVTTNTNLGTALEEAITGSVDVVFASADVTLTLTNTNGAQAARNLRLNLTGISGGPRNLLLGSGAHIEKFYIIANNLADDVTVQNSTGGTTYTVPAGRTGMVFNDGTDIVSALSFFEGALLSNAAIILGGEIDATPIGALSESTGKFSTLETTGNVTLGTSTVNLSTNELALVGTGSLTVPLGTTGQQPGSPAAGMVRFNSDTGSFEGYNGIKWGALGGGNATSSGFWQNIQNITSNQAIDTGYNASSVGPITIAAGVTVDVPAGSRWLVL